MFRVAFLLLLLALTIGWPFFARWTKRKSFAHYEANKIDYEKRRETGAYGLVEPREPTTWRDYFPVWPFVVPLVLLLVTAFFVCTAIIGAKTQGVLVSFGKADTERTLDPGLNWKAPWENVVEISTTRQTDVYNNSERDDSGDTRYHQDISVRLGNNHPAAGYAELIWEPNPDAVGTIYTDFRGDDPTTKLYENFVQTAFKQSVNDAFGTYNPTALMADIASSEDPIKAVSETDLSPDLDAIATIALANFQERVDNASVDGQPLINVIRVTVSYIDFGEQTEASIKAFQEEINKTINSQQAIETAKNLAAANNEIAASISKEPGVLTSRCLDLIRDGFAPPAAFNCFGPSVAQPVVPVQ